ncbi:MAG: hypothetical protein K8S00_07045 [Bacteroidales bacterium]|nr:hypothetical protein [Bacteroidales bacterium]
MWTYPNQLVFSPEEAYKPSTEYIAKLTSEIISFKTEEYRLKKEKISFHTPLLKLEKTNAYWGLSEDIHEKVEINVNLGFNYKVNSEQMNNLLEVFINDEKTDYKIISEGNHKKIELAVLNPEIEATKALARKIIVNKGLKCVNSEWKSKQIFREVINIPPKEKLMVTQMLSGFEEGKGVITVNTTQKLIGTDLKRFVSVDPKVNFEVKALKNGLLISGDFIEGESYKINISGNIKGVFGKEMGEDYSQYVSFGKVEPYIKFTDESAVYLSSKGNKNLGLTIINIPKVRLQIFKIFENNILQYMRNGKSWDYFYDDDQYHDWYGWDMDKNYGKVVLNKIIDTKTLPKNGNISLLNIDLNEINYSGDFKGLYIVRVESTEKKWLQDIQLVSVSDIGLIVKKGINNIKVFTNSILDATPLSGVKISFISSNNQKVYSASTNSEGLANLSDMENKIPGFSVAMVTAQKGEDFNYIIFNRSRVEKSRFDVGGKRSRGVNYDVFIYGDRDIYRPGDSVYINTVVRTMNREVVKDIPVKIKVVLPNGRKFLLLKKQLDNEGAAEARFFLPLGVLTGTFTIEVYSGNDIFLKSSRIKVEEFMPDRIKVDAKLDKEKYETGDTIELSVNAMNLFGPPAAGRKYEIEMQLNRRSFTPKDLNEYIFNITLPDRISFDRIVREGKTDDKGNAKENFLLPQHKNIGVLNGKIYTTVFDETGRPVNRLSHFEIYTQKIFFGIKRFDYWTGTKDPIQIAFIASDRNGKVLNGVPAIIQIKYITWETVIERRGRRFRYNSQRKEMLVFTKELSLNGTESQISYTPLRSGKYEVQIMSEEEDSYVNASFYAYGWGDTDYNSFEVSKEGEITMEFDKEIYEIGDQAKILFKSPFNGNILVTVEREDVIDHFYLKTNKKAASLNLKVRENFLPNVYITATAIRKIDDANIPLMVAHGFAPLKVEKLSNKLKITIDAVEKSRSKTRQRIKVKTKPNTELTIAVVDEGILQLTDFKTPDPYGYFYQKRALEVNSFDIYSFLFPELSSKVSSIAGGAGMDMGKRINPLAGKRVQLVAFWSGIKNTGSNGECSFDIDIPQFSGALRVMAVAYKGETFGMAEHTIKVADPVVISTALPRFLSPGDNAKVPVTITNTTSKSTKAKVSIKVEGPLEIQAESSISIELPANAEKQVMFDVAAIRNIGNAKVKVYVSAFNEEFSETVNIPVRPPSGLMKISAAGVVKGDDKLSFNVKTDFIEGTTSSSLLLSKSPIAEFSKDLSSLIRYPYGCLEQSVSSAFPLIYYRDLAKSLEQEKNTTVFNPDYFVQQAILKVESMQQYNGGMSYWPNGGYINWWATAYATHFLFEASKDGFELNSKVLDNAYKFLKQSVKKKESREYFYYDEDRVVKKMITAKREIFYSLYVLALADKQNLSIMNYYKSNLNLLSVDSRYMLAATYALIGDKYSYQAIIPASYGSKESKRTRGGCFNSAIREKAISLYTLLEADPDNGQIGFIAKSLSEELKRKKWLPTQEKSFSLLSLGKLAKKASEENVVASIKINGENIADFTGKTLKLVNDLNNKSVEITTAGSGRLYYFYEVEGISKSGKYKEGDSHLRVRKYFYDRFGNALTSDNFAQNDLVIVKVSIQSLDDTKVENVAITDILPACFEIENPRVTISRGMDWIKNKSHPDYMDIRDDRISFFCDATLRPKNFYYMIRVVSKGSFRMGPVGADAMYDGQYHSYSGGRTVNVR